MNAVGISIVILGVSLMVIGPLIIAAGRVPLVGKLPGDIDVTRNGARLFIPLTSMLVLSVAVTVIANVILRLLK